MSVLDELAKKRKPKPFKAEAGLLTEAEVETERRKGTPVVTVYSEEEKAEMRAKAKKRRDTFAELARKGFKP